MDKMIPISEARATLGELVEAAREEEIFIVKHSRPVGVLLSVEKYKALLDRLEDLEDALAVATDDGKDYVPFTRDADGRRAS